MAPRRDTSADSAARFLADRARRERRAAPQARPQPERAAPHRSVSRVVEKWRFVEKCAPGCWSAWVHQVGLPDDNITLGVTGKPLRVVATDERCYRPGNDDCQCHKFVDGTWHKRSHRKVECCARFTFGDERHDPSCPLTDREAR